MWGSFCDLAMAGGPPHKGKLLETGSRNYILAEPARYAEEARSAHVSAAITVFTDFRCN